MRPVGTLSGSRETLQHPRWKAFGNLTEILGLQWKIFFGHGCGEQSSTGQATPWWAHLSQQKAGQIAPWTPASHLWDAFLHVEGERCPHLTTVRQRNNHNARASVWHQRHLRSIDLAHVPYITLGMARVICSHLCVSPVWFVFLLVKQYLGDWNSLEELGSDRTCILQKMKKLWNYSHFFLTEFNLLIKEEREALVLLSKSKCHVLIILEQSILI